MLNAPKILDTFNISNYENNYGVLKVIVRTYRERKKAYEILTQNKPYYEKENLSQYQIFRDVSQGLRPKIRQHEISNNFANLIENCWAQDPDLRPSFIKIVKDFLDHVSDYFDINIIDEIFFNDYIEQATKSLDFSVLVNKKNI